MSAVCQGKSKNSINTGCKNYEMQQDLTEDIMHTPYVAKTLFRTLKTLPSVL